MTEKRQAVRVGGITTVAYDDAHSLRQFAHELNARGYHIRETPHFTICHPGSRSRSLVLLHTFNQVTVDEDVSPIVANELGALGVIRSVMDFSTIIYTIVASTYPSSAQWPESGRADIDQAAIWHHFHSNTLDRLRMCLSAAPSAADVNRSHIERFAAIYRRVIECVVGTSVLDVGSNVGHLALLLTEAATSVTVVGCDSRPNAIASANDLAQTAHSRRATFALRNVLDADFPAIGRYDTVTAVHLLEHLTEDELSNALGHMLEATSQRLIVSVPYEGTIQPLYGHRQTFTAAKLDQLGGWCVERMGGGRYRREDVGGGFLVIDRWSEPDSA